METEHNTIRNTRSFPRLRASLAFSNVGPTREEEEADYYLSLKRYSLLLSPREKKVYQSCTVCLLSVSVRDVSMGTELFEESEKT